MKRKEISEAFGYPESNATKLCLLTQKLHWVDSMPRIHFKKKKTYMSCGSILLLAHLKTRVKKCQSQSPSFAYPISGMQFQEEIKSLVLILNPFSCISRILVNFNKSKNSFQNKNSGRDFQNMENFPRLGRVIRWNGQKFCKFRNFLGLDRLIDLQLFVKH